MLDLPMGAFLLYRKESWIDAMSRTEEGKKVLKTLWRLQQTGAEIDKVRERQGGAAS